MAEIPSKSGKRIKQMSIPPFWGDVGVKKWSPFWLHLEFFCGDFAPPNVPGCHNLNEFSRPTEASLLECMRSAADCVKLTSESAILASESVKTSLKLASLHWSLGRDGL